MIPIRDTVPRQHFPFAVWTLIAINVFVFIRELALPEDITEQFIDLFGLVPARYTHAGAAEAGLYLGFWFLTRFFSGTLAVATHREVGGIAWWAHIGGFASGILFFSFFLRRRAPAPIAPTGFA